MKYSAIHPRTLTRYGLLTALCACLLGCENNANTVASDAVGGTVDFVITPSAVQLGFDEMTESFRAQGGDTPLVWTVSDAALGTITDTEGRVANYRRNGTSEGVNEIRVTDAIGRTAAAVVVQDDAVDARPLQLSPTSRTLREADGLVTLQATGGVPPYQWSVIDASLGSLSNTGLSASNYRRNGDAVGVNVVELKDSRDAVVTASIRQPALAAP